MKWVGIAFILCCCLNAAKAENVPQSMHWAATKSFMDRKTNVVKLRGDGSFSRDLETLHADEIDIYLNEDRIEARGRVVYQYDDYLIRADAIEINTKTRTGIVHNGNLSNGRLALRGTEMQLLGKDHIEIKNYEYTTCVDCPNSWSMAGSNADLTFDGYAYIKDFTFKVKDAALVWFPYMIFPMKTRRQSGLLFPRFGLSETHGMTFVQSYFWAINDWSDMTIGVGEYTVRGPRFEWEGRYAITDRSQGTFNLYYTRDSKLAPHQNARGAGKALVTQELPWGIEAKLRYFDLSDSGYAIDFSEDMPGRFEPVLTSELFFSRNDPNLSTTVSLKRIRNLLFFDNNEFKDGFDPATVQELPRVVINSNNQFLFGSKVAMGIEARFNRFIRSSGPLDYIDNPDNPTVPDEVIRQANRVSLIPNLYTTLNPWPWLSVVPSAQYRAFFYNFNSTKDYPNLQRGYLLTQAEASFQLERVVKGEEGEPSYKHTIRPQVTYSIIPTIQQPDDHKFMRLVQAKAGTGKYFDNSDVVPLGASQNLESYFTPLGHSLTYGFISQLYRKRQKEKVEFTEAQLAELGQRNIIPDTELSRLIELSSLQTWDIRESQRGGIELSPVFSRLLVSNGGFSWNTDYTYFFYLDRYTEAQLITFPSPHRVSTSLSWTFENITKNNALLFNRSISTGYTFSKLSSKISALSVSGKFSINDYLMPSFILTYDLLSPDHKLLESNIGLLYQSPSQCWRIEGALSNSIDRGTGVKLAFSLNLMGNGFTGLDDQLP